MTDGHRGEQPGWADRRHSPTFSPRVIRSSTGGSIACAMLPHQAVQRQVSESNHVEMSAPAAAWRHHGLRIRFAAGLSRRIWKPGDGRGKFVREGVAAGRQDRHRRQRAIQPLRGARGADPALRLLQGRPAGPPLLFHVLVQPVLRRLRELPEDV